MNIFDISKIDPEIGDFGGKMIMEGEKQEQRDGY